MRFDDIKVAGSALYPSSDEEVETAETALRITFPNGYRELITRFGEGLLGMYIRIYPPRRILSGLNNVHEWHKRIDEYWFWRDGEDLLSKARALESVIIGDTIDGDELCVHPDNGERIYVLPRHYDTIFIAGHALVSAIDWICSSGILVQPFEPREFEPFTSLERT